MILRRIDHGLPALELRLGLPRTRVPAWALAGISLLTACAPLQEIPSAGARQPNILFILADDLGYGDLGVYGSSVITTPNLDRLAAEGLRFTQYYANGPTCSPTRSALHTGSYPQRWGFREGIGSASRRGLPASIESLPERLSAAGYETWHVGKWHLGHSAVSFRPRAQGYDRFFGFLHAWQLPKTYHDPLLRRDEDAPRRHQGHLTDILTDRAVDWIRDRPSERPFFLSVWYFAPHKPLEPPARWASRYPRSPVGQYGALVSTLDENVGRLLEALEETGEAQDTIVVFTSDNGGVAPLHGGRNGPLRGGKNQLFEGGIRVPLLVRWPHRVAAGSIEEAVAMSHDWVPTLLDIAGAPPGRRRLDGKSLTPLLAGANAASDTTVFWEDARGTASSYAVRSGAWKLLRVGEKRFLFDLNRDVGESTNLLARRGDVAERLETAYRDWRRRVILVEDLPTLEEEAGPSTRLLADDPRLDPHDGELSVLSWLCRGREAPTSLEAEIRKGEWSLSWHDGRLAVSVGSTSGQVATTLSSDACRHVAFLIDHDGTPGGTGPGRVALWVDGQDVLDLATEEPPQPRRDPLTIDPVYRPQDTESAGWTGTRFLTSRLTREEIRALAADSTPPP